MVTGSSWNGTMVVPAMSAVSVTSTTPSSLASASIPGHRARDPSANPWKCCMCIMSGGNPVAST